MTTYVSDFTDCAIKATTPSRMMIIDTQANTVANLL